MYQQAKAQAEREGKPILALVHKSWCAACKALKKDFSRESEGLDRVVKASENYVMVNLEDDASEGEWEQELQPEDAAYIPHVVFFDYDGAQRPDIKSSSNEQYPYYYHSAASIADVMESALSKFKAKGSEDL